MRLIDFIITENDETTEDNDIMRFYMVFDDENMIYVYRPNFRYWNMQTPRSHHLAHVQKYASFKDAEKAARKLQNECNHMIAALSPDELDEKLKGKRPPHFVVREANIDIAGQRHVDEKKLKKIPSKGQVIVFSVDNPRYNSERTRYLGKFEDRLLDYLPKNLFAITVEHPLKARRFLDGVPPALLDAIRKKTVGREMYGAAGPAVASVNAVNIKDITHSHGE